jgi:hypothetical protein
VDDWIKKIENEKLKCKHPWLIYLNISREFIYANRCYGEVGFPHNCDIQKCKLAVKILTNIDNEEWREENFEQSKYFCYKCLILRVTLVWKSNFVTQFGDENNDKKRRIKVRRWTLKIICIHKIFTIYQWSPLTVSDNDRKLIKFDISLIYVVILWPNSWLVC